MCKMWIYGSLLLWASQFVQPFEVQYSGEDVVEEGSSFSIGCVISKYDSARWTKNRVGISSDDDYVFSEESDDDNNVHLTLKVESAKSDQSGDYRCSRFSATAHHVEVLSDDTTEVEETTDDRFGLPSVLLEINETIVLECNIASESYHVDWYKNGNRITVSKFSNKEVEGNQLIIREARRTDAGEYMCMVDDPEYEGASMGTVMHVKSEPYVESFPEKLNVIQGRPLLLECDAQGFPKPSISWFIGNEPLETFLQQNNLEISTLSNSEGLLGAMLSIQNPISNLYTCVAENSIGTSESSVFIVLRENMILTNEELPGQGLILKVPEPLELMCNTTDDNSLNVTWLKNGKPVIISDNLHISSENNSLVIHYTEDDDVGEYTCVVDENVNTTIEVKARTEFTEEFLKSHILVEGDKLVLHCKVKGTPPPVITWYKDDVLINGSGGHIMFESSDINFNDILTIQEVEFDDRAYYSCEASNEVNRVKSTIYVRIKDKLAALWPFLGICLEVSILCGIIFFYEKKRVKPDVFAGLKSSKAVPDNVKSKDVRQRK